MGGWRRRGQMAVLLLVLWAAAAWAVAACTPAGPGRWGAATPTPAYKSCYESIAQTKMTCGETAVTPAATPDAMADPTVNAEPETALWRRAVRWWTAIVRRVAPETGATR